MTHLTRKQYILTPLALDIPSMRKETLSSGANLFMGEGMIVRRFSHPLTGEIVLLGNAYRTDKVNGTLQDLFSSRRDLEDLIKDISGKWVLITPSTIYRDASGLMGAFMHTTGSGWCVSSSLALIKSLFHLKQKCEVQKEELSWQLLPSTVLENVVGLLASQLIEYTQKALYVKPNIWYENKSCLTTQEKVQELSIRLKNTLVNISAENKDVWIALTAGKDSRLSFAAAISAGIKFSTYTAQHDNISHGDRKIPRLIANKFNIPYRYIKKRPFSWQKKKEYLEFSCYNSNGADMSFFAYGQFDQLPHNAIIVRSGIFEAAQHYARKYTLNSIDGFRTGLKSFFSSSFQDSMQSEALDLWLSSVASSSTDFIDIRDRYYIEQRVGGWAAAIEQSLDICDFTSIQIANSASIINLLLSCNESERRDLAMSYLPIEMMCPDLMRFQFNPKSAADAISHYFGLLFSPRTFMNKLLRFKQ